jgi:LacI family transcriptional regulator
LENVVALRNGKPGFGYRDVAHVKKKRSTIEDVAHLAGVSIKTVSRVFNDEPHVRPATHDRVVEAAQRLDYRPNLSARRLATNRAFVIGMLYENPNSDYVTEMQYGSLDACQLHGYGLLIQPCNVRSSTLVDDIVDLKHRATVDGFIALQPISDVVEFNEAILENDIPCVRVSQRPYEGLPWISVGDEEAAANMTDYLLGLGHRRIGFIMGHPDHGSSHDRLAGYRRALERHHIDFDEDLVQQGFFDYESGYLCARELLSMEPPPTAVFASNDHMAMGVLTVAHELGLEVPGDLSVAGFDDTSFSRFSWPPLTTVCQPIAQLAQLATETLLHLLKGNSEAITDRCVEANLVLRETTAGPLDRLKRKRGE